MINFDPADIQSTGVGIAAFLATVLTVFIFLSARREKLGYALFFTFASGAIWAWFGFLYHIIPDLALARDARVISVIGIVFLNISELNFARVYLSERIAIGPYIRRAICAFVAVAVVLVGILLADLAGTRLVVGNLLLPTKIVLAPDAGPFMGVLIAFYIMCTAFAGALLAWRAELASDMADRRRALLLFASMTLGLVLGGTRFTPWYGFDFFPAIGDLGYPLYTFAALYSIKQYKLLNLEVAAAQLLIFTIWTISFFRLLLDTSIRSAIPDIILFGSALILGVALLRSIIREAQTQREMARLTIERGKSEFVTIAAHQLRTPLTAVRWVLNALLNDSKTPLSDEQRMLVQKGAQAADAMKALANDLLDVDRMDAGFFEYKLEPGDLRDAARVAAGILEDTGLEKKVHIELSLEDNIPPVRYDRGKLALVIENLIDNAIKYSPAGETVHVRVGRDGKDAVVLIEDHGIGIPVEDQARLFEKFFRSDNARHAVADGSGLGLFIAKRIMEAHGGSIALSSEGAGKGTTATLRLPVQ